MCQLLIHLRAEGYDVIARHHLEVEYQTGSPVVSNILFGGLITAFYRSYIFEPYHTTGERIGPDDLLLYLIFRLVREHDLHRTLRIVLSADGTQSLHRQLCLQRVQVDAVHGQPLDIYRDSYLFRLLPHDTQLTHLGDGSQRRAYLFGVILQLTR